MKISICRARIGTVIVCLFVCVHACVVCAVVFVNSQTTKAMQLKSSGCVLNHGITFLVIRLLLYRLLKWSAA